MSRGVRWFLVGSVVLVTLAGCGRGYHAICGEREPWRREAEVACLNSGTVKESAGLVRISPIEGPGMCGADFPLKVSALGEGSALGYVDEPVRPPGSIAGASRPAPQPRWPISQQQPSVRAAAVRRRPAARRADVDRSARHRAAVSAAAYPQQQVLGAPPSNLQAPPDWQRSDRQPAYDPVPSRRSAAPPPEIETEELPPYAQPGRGADGAAASTQPSRCRRSVRRAIRRWPPRTPIEVKPAATLACPIVSALDRWFANAVQPAARKWFNQPVVEIKQISAYSCRGMNGQPGAHISEHAFGNALDIAAFVLADGHRITVKDGWNGSPEEQGFLRDVQGSACDQFTTVLAPGSNQFHYDHIHVDLMRRASGRRICQPGAVDGEVVASRARRTRDTRHRGRSSRRRRGATIRRSSRATIRSPGAATPAAAIRPPPVRSPRGGPGSRTRRPRTSTGSRSRARGRRSTGAATTPQGLLSGSFGAA